MKLKLRDFLFHKSKKNKVYQFLSRPYMVIWIMSIAPFFSILDRNFSYFFGVAVALLLLWSSRWDWKRFGLARKFTFQTLGKGILIAIVTFCIVSVAIEPFLEIYLGKIDLSSVEDIKGNLQSYIILLVIMWIFAAFGEEFLFSGYYMKHLAEYLGNTDKAWRYSAVILSFYFAISHSYQGLTGVIAILLSSFIFFFTFYKNRENLLLLIIVHGVYDTIGLTLIYLEQDRFLVEWLLNQIRS